MHQFLTGSLGNQITQCPRLRRRRSKAFRKPFSPSRSKDTSGIKTKLTSLHGQSGARGKWRMTPHDFHQTNSHGRPFCSTWAHWMAFTASEIAVSYPKVFWIIFRSLSIVLGMPMMPIFRFLFVTSSVMHSAARIVPFAADTEQDVNIHPLQGIDQFTDILPAPDEERMLPPRQRRL